MEFTFLIDTHKW